MGQRHTHTDIAGTTISSIIPEVCLHANGVIKDPLGCNEFRTLVGSLHDKPGLSEMLETWLLIRVSSMAYILYAVHRLSMRTITPSLKMG